MAKVMLSIPDDFLKQVDEVAKSRHQTRSEYYRELARKDIEERRSVSEPEEVYRRLRQIVERRHVASWDVMADILRQQDVEPSERLPEQVHDSPDDDQ